MSRPSFGLPCPRCGACEHRVLETRAPKRRRQCNYCGAKFTTVETVTGTVAGKKNVALPVGATPTHESSTI